jgi:hypothetical protein
MSPLDLPVLELDFEKDRTEWVDLGMRGLAQAYGDSEPEYSINDLLPEEGQ